MSGERLFLHQLLHFHNLGIRGIFQPDQIALSEFRRAEEMILEHGEAVPLLALVAGSIRKIRGAKDGLELPSPEPHAPGKRGVSEVER